MAISVLTPLANNVPIVDEKGNPTPYFQRMLQQLLQEKDELQEAVDLTAGIDIIAGTGLDGGGPLDGSADVTLDLEDTAVTPGTYGDASNIPVLDIDQQGRITGASEVAVSGGGGGAWALLGTGQTATGLYDFAVDGAKATIDFTNLTGYQDLMLWMDGVTKSVSGGFQVQVSVDNGSTWYTTSGDYVQLAATGVGTNTTSAGFHNTATTAARSQVIEGSLMGVANAPKFFYSEAVGILTRFVASSSAVNALRFTPTAGGNITGGKVWVFAR